MKKITLLFYCLLIGLINFGQFASFFSPNTMLNPGGGSIGIAKEPYNVSGRNWNKFRQRISLIRYNENGQVQKTANLAESKNIFSIFYIDLKRIGNKFWLVYIEPAERNDIGNVKAMEVNPVTLETGSPITIASSESINSSLKLMFGMSELRVVSESSPGELYTFLFIGTGRGDFFISCLDQDLKTVWSKKETIKGLDDYKIKSIKIDDDGVIYMAYVNRKKPFVSVYSKDGIGKEYSFSMGNATPKDIYLLVSQKTNTVIATGAYFEGSNNCAGVYKTNIDRGNYSWGELIKSPFPVSLLGQFSRDGFASTNARKRGLKPKFSGKMYELPDGSTGYIAEMRNFASGEKVSATHFASLLVVNFGPSAAFMSRVPKYNLLGGLVTANQYYAGICGSNIVLFYRDIASNLERALALDAKITRSEKNTILVEAIIERDGAVKRRQAGDGEDVAAGIRKALSNECKGL